MSKHVEPCSTNDYNGISGTLSYAQPHVSFLGFLASLTAVLFLQFLWHVPELPSHKERGVTREQEGLWKELLHSSHSLDTSISVQEHRPSYSTLKKINFCSSSPQWIAIFWYFHASGLIRPLSLTYIFIICRYARLKNTAITNNTILLKSRYLPLRQLKSQRKC